jgi:hypothetical protein
MKSLGYLKTLTSLPASDTVRFYSITTCQRPRNEDLTALKPNKKSSQLLTADFESRDGEIRTHDLHVPNVAR